MTGLFIIGLVLGIGLFIVRHLPPPLLTDPLDQLSLAVAGGLTVLSLATLVAALPRVWSVPLGLLFVLSLPYLLYRSWIRRLTVGPAATAAPGPVRAWRPGAATVALLLCLLMGGWFRLRHLGYSEFQGDEARAVLMAGHLLAERDAGILLLHKKGPLEVLLPAAGLKRGDLSEGTARLPFALASLAALAAIHALGKRLWGPRAALITLSLAAVDGYLIAFGRIVQYQSLVLLFGVTAVACAWRWSRRDLDGPRAAGGDAGRAAGGDWEILLAAGLIGMGTWAHYEAVLALPPVLLLAWERARREASSVGGALRRLLPPVLTLALVVAAFYLPFARHPHFQETWRYIAERRVGGSPPYNMLGDYFQRASFYNASTYVLLIAGAALAALALRLGRLWGRAGRRGAALWLVGLALLFWRPDWFQLAPATDDTPARSAAILLFAPALALVAAGRWRSRDPRDAAWRVLVVWLFFPLLAAGFLVKKPHTHFYTLLPAWLLIVGQALDALWVQAEARWGRRGRAVGAVAGFLALLVFGWHQQVVFIRHHPEYKRVYPEARLPGYWTPFGDEPPRGGYFGFPYRAGWSVVRDLYRMGLLAGSYDSNEELLITGWYTRGAPRCAESPANTFVAWRPQDEEDLPLEEIRRTQRLWAVVSVEGQPKLELYRRAAPDGKEPLPLDADMDPRALAEAVLGVEAATGASTGDAVDAALARLNAESPPSVAQALELDAAALGEAAVGCP
ncbi:MAG TPA: hypothetical protein PK826_02665 [Anaerolineae bacterium]|nr:hypothetical protein [Anaerolineae bacterium]